MISKKDLQNIVKREIEGKTDLSAVTNAINKQMQFASAHIDELDPEAKEMIDEQLKLMKELADRAVEQVRHQPDSKSKREFIRIGRKAQGSHFDIEDLVRQLEKELEPDDELARDTHEIFNFTAQLLLNYLCDITDNRLAGGGQTLAQLGLIYSAVEEVYIALHLADHSFAPQSMSHTRHVLESIDLITLFHKDPSYLAYWISADYKEREKVSPKNVRVALGGPKFDPIYSMLSDIGSHSSFKYVQTKMQREVVEGEKELPGDGDVLKVRINLGGTSDPFHTLQARVACIASVLKLLARVADIYSSHLLEDEMKKELAEANARQKAYIEKHYFPVLRKAGIDPVWPVAE